MVTGADETAGPPVLRYAQVWEDADVLLEALDIGPDDVCLSIASGGDNTLAMLAKNPARVIAIDRNPAQLFCLEIKATAFGCLDHASLLELMGSRASTNRAALYERCRPMLSEAARSFWDARQSIIVKHGIGGAGRFERFARIFRRWALPLVLSRNSVEEVCAKKTVAERERFFDDHWRRPGLRLLVRGFFSKPVISLLGGRVVVFDHVEGRISDHVVDKVRHGFRTLAPSDNPYLHWILCGFHGEALPVALRPENHRAIRDNLHKLEWHLSTLEDFIGKCRGSNTKIDKFNLSNVFDYMSAGQYRTRLAVLVAISNPGARLVYWNMMVPRSCPANLATALSPLRELAARLHGQDKAIFYSILNIDQVGPASGLDRDGMATGSGEMQSSKSRPLLPAP